MLNMVLFITTIVTDLIHSLTLYLAVILSLSCKIFLALKDLIPMMSEYTVLETGTRRRQPRGEKKQVKVSPYCLICYGDYTNPKQLECGHTFCRACIEKYVNPKLMVECPECREVKQEITE